MGTTDEALIAAIAAGDHLSFEVFYRRTIDRVMRQAYRRCRDPHEVAELCASVFLSVWEGASTFDPQRGTASAWMSGIVSRRFVDLRRRGARTIALRSRLAARSVVGIDDEARIVERLDAVAASDQLVAALRELPDAQREVMVLTALDGLSVAETADLLGVHQTAVRMRRSRARRSLQRRLGPTFDGRTTTDSHLEVAK